MPSNSELVRVLESARKDLLELSTRNRLLNTPRHQRRSKTLEIEDELSSEIFRILIQEQKTMAFLPRDQPRENEVPLRATEISTEDGSSDPVDQEDLPGEITTNDLGQPEEEETLDEEGIAARHQDAMLQTDLDDTRLQKKLLSLFYDARTAEEEQGVNILYLALGFLRWYESETSDRPRDSPLILVPVELVRSSVGGRIRLAVRDEDLATNLTLQERLKADFGILIPNLPGSEDLSPTVYFQSVRDSIEGRPRWEVLENDIVLGFFSFAKFLMYADLNAERWGSQGALERHSVLSKLLGEGFGPSESLWPDEGRIDEYLPPAEMVHVMDADSSQIEAIEWVKAGRSLVIQGPPGTGKSQTITNLIAAAVAKGQRVLFVAEKLAALEVVHARMQAIGLGDLCLELHNRKANKKAVLGELRRTLDVAPTVCRTAIDEYTRRLQNRRDQLNQHTDALNTELEPCSLTPYRILGELVRCMARSTRSPSLTLDGALRWTQPEFEERMNALREIARRLEGKGTPAEHPWRGVSLGAILPMDVKRIAERLPLLDSLLSVLRTSAETLATILNRPGDSTLLTIEAHIELARALATVPPMDLASFSEPEWLAARQDLRRLVDTGARIAQRQARFAQAVSRDAWDWDSTQVARHLRTYRRSPVRFLYKSYRHARMEFAGRMGRAPQNLDRDLGLLGELQGIRKALADFDAHQQLGARVFRSHWAGVRSNWRTLHALLDWVEVMADKFGIEALLTLVRLPEVETLSRIADSSQHALEQVRRELSELLPQLQLSSEIAFGTDDLNAVSLADLATRISVWSRQTDQLSSWPPIWAALCRLKDLDLTGVANGLFDGSLASSDAVEQVHYAYHECWMREVMNRFPDLSVFDGELHSLVVEDFRNLDRKRIDLAREEVALAHRRRLPAVSGGGAEMGVLLHEMQKKRRHLAIRPLMEQASGVIQRIKPVFMMSPLSISQFLPAAKVEFDLLLIDEASQVQPVDALGAILRSRQVVVVGDDKQLPPTNFFGRDDESEDEDTTSVRDLESILGLCTSKGLTSRMLRWHYRSQHHSLIAFSNREFYDERLKVVPSPFPCTAAMGLRFHHVSDGLFERGTSARNTPEARRVARAAIDHARLYPKQSLGIGTFSVSQRDAILSELEVLWRTEEDVRGFFSAGKSEPFFVKNLENLQGDERDVIFVSVGYGRDADGFFAMHFGPLSIEGGERRLNVLASRARLRCEVFSSIRDVDIDLARARSRGAAALRVFLGYAERGSFDTGIATGKDFDSPFEEEVAKALVRLGFEVDPQVGIAGFFVDLGLKDPDVLGRYLLGIECDGASYHSSRSARDRDRLRQEVLENRGWTIHRIWSTDWFKDPDKEVRRVLSAIERARLVCRDSYRAEQETSGQSMDSARRALGGMPESVGTGGASTEVDEQRVLSSLSEAGRPLGRGDILERTGIQPERWNSVIRGLVTSGVVQREGDKRGTKYFIPKQGETGTSLLSSQPIEHSSMPFTSKAIVAALGRNGRPMTKAELMLEPGVVGEDWSQAISELYRAGVLRRATNTDEIAHELRPGSAFDPRL